VLGIVRTGVRADSTHWSACTAVQEPDFKPQCTGAVLYYPKLILYCTVMRCNCTSVCTAV